MPIDLKDIGKDKSEKIREVFQGLNRKFEEEEAQRRAAKLGVPYFDLNAFPIDGETLELWPRAQAEAAQAVPFYREEKAVKVGAVDFDNPEFKKFLALLAEQKFKVEIYLVSRAGFQSSLSQYKKVLIHTETSQHQVSLSPGPGVLKKLQNLPADEEATLKISAT